MLKHQNVTDTRCSKALNLRMIPCHFSFTSFRIIHKSTHNSRGNLALPFTFDVGLIDLTTTNEIANLIRFRQSHAHY